MEPVRGPQTPVAPPSHKRRAKSGKPRGPRRSQPNGLSRKIARSRGARFYPNQSSSTMDAPQPYCQGSTRPSLFSYAVTKPYSLYIEFAMPRPANASLQTRILLGALWAEPDRWRHGVSLTKQAALKPGTLYPLLARLEVQGFLESRWEQPDRPGRPPRHAYRLTATGRALAEERSIIGSHTALTPLPVAT